MTWLLLILVLLLLAHVGVLLLLLLRVLSVLLPTWLAVEYLDVVQVVDVEVQIAHTLRGLLLSIVLLMLPLCLISFVLVSELFLHFCLIKLSINYPTNL